MFWSEMVVGLQILLGLCMAMIVGEWASKIVLKLFPQLYDIADRFPAAHYDDAKSQRSVSTEQEPIASQKGTGEWTQMRHDNVA